MVHEGRIEIHGRCIGSEMHALSTRLLQEDSLGARGQDRVGGRRDEGAVLRDA